MPRFSRFLCLAALVAVLTPGLLAQGRYATSVIDFSSQFSETMWSAEQALGVPNTYPFYGDFTSAWASATRDGQREFLELGFDGAAPASIVWIYETYEAGAVDTVYVRNAATGEFVEVWSGTAVPVPFTSRINPIRFPQTAFDVDAVRIAVNSPAVPNYNEIDAVRLFEENEIVSVGVYTVGSRTVAPGGLIAFRLDIINNTNSPKTGALFFYVERGGTVVSQGDLATGMLDALGRNGLNYGLTAPSSVPAGVYNYTVCAGLTIDAPIACSDPIALTVTGSLAGAGGTGAEWEAVVSPTEAAKYAGQSSTQAAARTGEAAVAYPNPFAERTEIAFMLADASDVSLVVYDVRGRAVATLADGPMAAGRHALTFDAAGLPSGVYVYRLIAGVKVQTGRVTLVQ